MKKVKVRNLKEGDRVRGYEWTTVKRVNEYPKRLCGTIVEIEFNDAGLKIYPKSMDELVTVEEE